MARQTWTGSALTTATTRAYNGTALVPVTSRAWNGTTLVPVNITLTPGPVPVVAAVGATGQSGTGTETSVTVPMPAGIVAGQLLVLFAAIKASAVTPVLTGWVQGDTQINSSACSLVGFTRVADGTEGASAVLSYGTGGTKTGRAAAVALRVTGAGTVETGTHNGATGATSLPVPATGALGIGGDNRLVLGVWASPNAANTWGLDAGLTSVAAVNSGAATSSHIALVIGRHEVDTGSTSSTTTSTATAGLLAGLLTPIAPVYS